MAKVRKKAGQTAYNAPLTDEARAAIWTLTEEGQSQRSVGKMLDVAPSTVSKELAQDPVRLEALRARQREARAQGWKRIEELGLEELVGWLERLRDYRTGKKRRTKKSIEDLDRLPRVLQAVRAAAETSTKTVQLLTGGLTERIGSDTASDSNLDPEQLIEMAVQFNCVEMLPPKLRVIATARQKGRKQ